MFSLPKFARKGWPVRILAYALLLAIFSLSLHFELHMEAGAAKVSYSSFAKIRKNFKYNHGARPEVALTTTSLHWTTSFAPYFRSVVDKQNLPGLHLLKSVIIRAPPSTLYFI
jgi:hypothetical protein